MTKVLATRPALLDLADNGMIDLDIPLGLQWDRAAGTPVGAATPAELMSYRGGFPSQIDLRTFQAATPEGLIEAVLAIEPVTDSAQSVYSDVGFLALGMAVADLGGSPLDVAVSRRGPLRFVRQGQPLPGPAVATENCPWRRRLVVGTVHDENAHLLGGVAGHAGAFGTIGGVAEVVAGVLCNPGNRLGLGWRSLGDKKFGATGFVGNVIRFAPQADRAVAILTNRVHPVRKDRTVFNEWVKEVAAAVEI